MDVSVEQPLGGNLRLTERIESVYSLVLVMVLWEAVGQLEVIHYHFLPPLSDILIQFWMLSASGELFFHAFVTLRRAFVGLLIAIAVGVPIGILMARSRVANWFFDPIVMLGYPVPKISLVPMFILWFGIGDLGKIALVAVDCSFPIILNTFQGARSVDERLIWSANMMGTDDRKLLRKVILPGALPDILTGIQIAVPISLIVAFVFEMISGGDGLGFLEITGVRLFEPTTVFAVLIAVMIIGLLLDRGLRQGRAWLLAWE